MVRAQKRVQSRTARLPSATAASRPCAATPNSPTPGRSANGSSSASTRRTKSPSRREC